MHWTLYVDLDAYYVACESRDRPELLGQPVIVGPSPAAAPTRGVVLSASYEARAFGVHSAQPVAQAARLCPNAIWVPADFAKYGRVAEEVRTLLRRFSPEVLPLSIDEAAVRLDVADAETARCLALTIQRALADELHLPASIGVATSRVVAKIASDRAKPGGIQVVRAGEEARYLAPLPVRAIPGVGPKTEARLRAAGVTTIGELASRRPSELRSSAGGFARDLVLLARGEATDPTEVDSGPRSRSTDRTFARDATTWSELADALRPLAVDLASSLESEGLRYATVGVAFRWADFQRSQRSRSLGAAHEGPEPLVAASLRLGRELWASEQARRGRSVRTVSVRTEHLSERTQRQASLDHFAPANERSPGADPGARAQ
ncbi:MAG TPA: DNA polymerase IV [Thermoplasmata archaeon]|nr:DNA polymerase IV [Thermoplasmata archaeon]